MNAFTHQQRADRSLRPGARNLRSRHSVLVQVAGDGVHRFAHRALAYDAGHHLAGVDLGRPRTTPRSLRTASASCVRLRMKSRSSSANTTAMCAMRIEADTLAWRGEADRILGFWKERLMPDPTACVPAVYTGVRFKNAADSEYASDASKRPKLL